MENNQVPKRKVVFIGDTQVGKTSIVTRIQENVFNPDIEVFFFKNFQKP